MKLWSNDKTEEDVKQHASDDIDSVIFNLLEDILCLRECVDELSEAHTEGEIAKILRQYDINT